MKGKDNGGGGGGGGGGVKGGAGGVGGVFSFFFNLLNLYLMTKSTPCGPGPFFTRSPAISSFAAFKFP